MKIRTSRSSRRLLLTLATTAAVLGTASTASAWTIAGSPGTFSGSQTGSTTLSVSGTPIVTCSGGSFTGAATNGTGLSGTGLVSLTAFSLGTCTSTPPIGLSVTALPYSIDATSYDSFTQTTSGVMNGVWINASSPFCSFRVTGRAGVRFSNLADALEISPTGSALTVTNVSGCLGIVSNGNIATIAATYAVTPTSLALTSP